MRVNELEQLGQVSYSQRARAEGYTEVYIVHLNHPPPLHLNFPQHGGGGGCEVFNLKR